MKALIKTVLTFLLPVIAVPAFLQGAAQVVSEDPDGAILVRGGDYAVTVGLSLMEGDVIESGDSTVIVSFSDGSRLTVYPNSAVRIKGLSEDSATLDLVRGEILGDAMDDSSFTVDTVVGRASVSGGVFGILMNQMGEGWTLQVRNLDARVSFTGAPDLDTSNVTVSMLEPDEQVDIPTGEEIIVRGIYNEDEEFFALTREGAAIASIDTDTIGQLQEAAQEMSAVEIPGPPVEVPAGDGGVIIDIPYQDVETASEKG